LILFINLFTKFIYQICDWQLLKYRKKVWFWFLNDSCALFWCEANTVLPLFTLSFCFRIILVNPGFVSSYPFDWKFESWAFSINATVFVFARQLKLLEQFLHSSFRMFKSSLKISEHYCFLFYHLDQKVPGIITKWCSESADLSSVFLVRLPHLSLTFPPNFITIAWHL